MSHRFFLAAALGTMLTGGLTTAAFSQSTYEQNSSSNTASGYNVSTSSQTVIGSDHQTGGATAGDAQTMQNIQQQIQRQRQMPQRP